MALIWNEVEIQWLLHSSSGPTGRMLQTVGALVETAAKAECPVDTGRLRSSITHRVEGDGGDLVAIIGTNVEYAGFVHNGTKHMRARPFLVNGMHTVLGRMGSGA